jgi:hypothetical protein
MNQNFCLVFTFNNLVHRIPSFDKLVVKLGMHIFSETEDDAELTMRIRKIDVHENYDQLTKVGRSTNLSHYLY